MPKNTREWITLIALAVGITAAVLDMRPIAAFAFFVTIIFGLAATKIEKHANRYRL